MYVNDSAGNAISKLKAKKLMQMSQVLNEFENKQKPNLSHVQQILYGKISWYGRDSSSPVMRRVMGAKSEFGRLFGLGYDGKSAFDCMLIIARLVRLRRSLARYLTDSYSVISQSFQKVNDYTGYWLIHFLRNSNKNCVHAKGVRWRAAKVSGRIQVFANCRSSRRRGLWQSK
jgi:hypothetical protein